MRMNRLAAAILALGMLSSNAHANIFNTYGNHEGGLIPWSPDTERNYRGTAAAHCASYNKVAYITGIVRGYGNYISFTCRYHRNYDPVTAGMSIWWSRR